MPLNENYINFSDQELMDLIRESDDAAFKILYDRHIQNLYRYASKLKFSNEERDDVLQEIFLSVWNRRLELKIDNVQSWLYMAVRKKILENLRNQKVKDSYINSLSNFISPFYDSITDQLQEKQLKEFIEKEISKLPPKMRRIFIMSRMDYLSHKEIAETLSLSESTVKKQVNNVLRIFRSKINLDDAYSLILLSILTNLK